MFRFLLFIFFFQAEDGIRDRTVTGVQTCALPIYDIPKPRERHRPLDVGGIAPSQADDAARAALECHRQAVSQVQAGRVPARWEVRRAGKDSTSRCRIKSSRRKKNVI